MQVDGNLPDMPEVAGDVQADWLQQAREACWRRFIGAADAYLHTQDPKPAKAYLARVEADHGAEVAARARKELWGWIRKRKT